MNKSVIIAGIGTEIGKTVISAIMTQAWQADYWKPVQSGNPEDADALFIQKMVVNPNMKILDSAYLLSQPLSPHSAAEIDGIAIELDQINTPKTDRNLVIELAGGILVPLNSKETNLDLIKKLNFPVILVSKNYLGSINHTLLSFEILKKNQINLLGIVFNGPINESGEKFILNYTQLPMLLRVHEELEITPKIIQQYAQQIAQ